MSADPWYSGRRVAPGEINRADFLAELDDQPWAADALCAQIDGELFYPEKGGSTREAKAICGSCEVRDDCLSYALEHDERHGIWGGLSERERRKLKPRRRPGRPSTQSAGVEP